MSWNEPDWLPYWDGPDADELDAADDAAADAADAANDEAWLEENA